MTSLDPTNISNSTVLGRYNFDDVEDDEDADEEIKTKRRQQNFRFPQAFNPLYVAIPTGAVCVLLAVAIGVILLCFRRFQRRIDGGESRAASNLEEQMNVAEDREYPSLSSPPHRRQMALLSLADDDARQTARSSSSDDVTCVYHCYHGYCSRAAIGANLIGECACAPDRLYANEQRTKEANADVQDKFYL